MKLFSKLCSNVYKVIIHFLSFVVVIHQNFPIAILYWRYWLSRVFSLSFPYNSPEIFTVLSFCELLSPIRDFCITYQPFDTISNSFIQGSSMRIIVDLVEFQKTITFVLFFLYFVGYPWKLVFPLSHLSG